MLIKPSDQADFYYDTADGGAGISPQLREMGEEDREALLRLSQQVEALAQSLDRMAQPGVWDGGASLFGEFKRDYRAPDPSVMGGFGAAHAAPTLPDPKLVRQIIANRQARAQFFDPQLFSDPAWDMLLDLTAAHGEGVQVSVTSLCIAAGVSATTALRWLTQMVENGIFVRMPDPVDKRRAFIALSDKTITAMAGYFASLRFPVEMAV